VANIIQQHLFSWDQVDSSSDLHRLQLALTHLPDEKVVQALERRRGKGRDDYPVRPMWNALLAGIVLQHPTVESLLRELRRNAELRQLCGFNPLHGAEAAPPPWAMSRFVAGVVEELDAVEDMFDQEVKAMRHLLPGFGKHLAFDGKAVPSYSTGQRSSTSGMTSDPDASWGTKTYRGVDAKGKAWTKVTRWFGYQLHLIVDSTYELPVAFEMMSGSTSEITRLLPMVERMNRTHSEIVECCSDLSADRGLDSGPANKELWETYRVRPVVDARKLWKDEKAEQGRDPSREITRSLRPEKADTIVYTERGEVRCVCPVSGEETKMAFWGLEADRGTLKYRCPAAAYGFECRGRAMCDQAARGAAGEFGRVVRVPLDTDRRIFTPVPRDTLTWTRLYAARTSVERVNGRVDQSFGFERHTIRGLQKMQARMGLALAVMLAMAIGFVKEGRPQLMRSLVRSPRARPLAA